MGFVPRAFSQGTSGTIQSLVKDFTGAAIIGAAVTVKNATTGLTRRSETDANGYNLYNLPPRESIQSQLRRMASRGHRRVWRAFPVLGKLQRSASATVQHDPAVSLLFLRTVE
jgi:hypothetical protein